MFLVVPWSNQLDMRNLMYQNINAMPGMYFVPYVYDSRVDIFFRPDYSLGQPIEVSDESDDPEAVLVTDPQQLQTYSSLLQVPITVPLIILNPEEIQEGYSSNIPESPSGITSSEQVAGASPGYGSTQLIERTIWLFGFHVPELKGGTCYKVFKTPFGKFKIPYPCLYRRDSEINFWATIWYPSSAEDYLKQEINECLIEAKGAAKGAGVTAFLSNWSLGVKGAAAAALTAAFSAFEISFVECLKNIPSEVRKNVYYQISWEQIRTSGWKRV